MTAINGCKGHGIDQIGLADHGTAGIELAHRYCRRAGGCVVFADETDLTRVKPGIRVIHAILEAHSGDPSVGVFRNLRPIFLSQRRLRDARAQLHCAVG
ncbi:hypothetical protein SDC9_211872 [bioreactor metagenome]|uniref:Uncharacterized protein n=1 Tax=bioreactor metagenome TaxID=1076179 RepID=A0A645JKJ1_9ZZZZ